MKRDLPSFLFLVAVGAVSGFASTLAVVLLTRPKASTPLAPSNDSL